MGAGLQDGVNGGRLQGYHQVLSEVERHVFFPVLSEIAALLRRNWVVTLQYIPRECNSAADCLAKIDVRSNLSQHVEVEPFI